MSVLFATFTQYWRSPAETATQFRVWSGAHLRSYVERRGVQWILDAILGSLSIHLAYMLRFDMAVPASLQPEMWSWSAVMLFLEPLVIALGQGYRSTWKHFGLRDMQQLGLRQCVILVVLAIVATPQIPRWMPISVALIYMVLSTVLLASVRVLRRLDYEATARMTSSGNVLLVGTAATASAALRQLQPVYGTRLVGIITDEAAYDRLRINGVPVLGTVAQLGAVLSQRSITLLLLSTAELPAMGEIVRVASDLNVNVKLLPSVHDVVGNAVRINRIVAPKDIHTGHVVENEEESHASVAACFRNRTVLITGAAGSIGSELVRQVQRTEATRLLLLDQDENGIFELLNQLGNDPRFLPVVVDIRDQEAIQNLFQRERPQIVLHAAAYKHVPLMEQSPCEAVLNNVIGTRTLAEAAISFASERFVMISSDKAVNPSSVMGASKRLAEIVIRDITERMPETVGTRFACVRFGNVLGSRGSVLPLFLKQIEQGGPLTVTHEDMTRFFMTIPQAVSLVLRAATLASRGDIYMLDMGDPVLIVRFARELIQYSGLIPDRDIKISIVGSRPGEKLHEELWSKDAEVSQTSFRHILQVKQERVAADFTQKLQRLEAEARNRDVDRVRTMIRELEINYLSA